jgi:hypothetical protein
MMPKTRGSVACWRWRSVSGTAELLPHGDLASELTAIAHDDEFAACDERRLLNRLRADLTVAGTSAARRREYRLGDMLGAPPRSGRAKQPKGPGRGGAVPQLPHWHLPR